MYLWLFLFKLYKPCGVGVGSSWIPFLAVQKAYLIAYLREDAMGASDGPRLSEIQKQVLQTI